MYFTEKRGKKVYLFLGQQAVVKNSDIIGVFDIEKSSVSKDTRDFLRKSEQKKIVKTVSYELPRSFVVCERDGNKNVYISQISTATLSKRKII